MEQMTSPDTSTPNRVDATLVAARQRYVDANPTSASWAQRAAAVLPGGNTRSVLHFDPFPFRVASAEGRYLVDVDDHRYVDLLGNYTAGLLGHSPEPVRAAAHAAIDGGWALGAVHPNEVRLAELIAARFASIEQVRFTNSGTEANLMATRAGDEPHRPSAGAGVRRWLPRGRHHLRGTPRCQRAARLDRLDLQRPRRDRGGVRRRGRLESPRCSSSHCKVRPAAFLVIRTSFGRCAGTATRSAPS